MEDVEAKLKSPNEKLPKGWVLTTLKDTCKMYQPKTISKKEMIEGGEFPVFGANGIIGSYNQYNHEEPQVLVTCRGATCGTVNLSEHYSWINGNAMVINPIAGAIDQSFLIYLLKGGIKLEKAITGTAQPQITRNSLEPLELPLPPLNEQKRIVAKIEELFSELDAGEQSLRDARQQLTLYRQSLLKQAFEGKLTEAWRANNPDKLEAPETLLEQFTAKGSKGSTVHKCKNWITMPFGDLCDYITSGSRGWAKYYADAGSLFIRAQNLKTDSLKFDDIAYVSLPEKAEGTRTLIQLHDILITITGANVTKTATVEKDLGEAYVSQHVALCRLQKPSISNFLFHYIVSPADGRKQLEKAAYGAGKPGLNLTNIRTLSVPLCSQAEQNEIVSILDEQFTAIEQNEKEIDHSLTQSQALRQAILRKAFEGNL